MNEEKKEILSSQLMFSVGCFIQGSSLILNFATATTKQDTWIAVIIGLIISLPILGIYFLLAKKHPGMNIIDITISVFGNVLGRILSLVYIYFFFSLTFLNTEVLGNFMNTFVLKETPPVFIYIPFIFSCVYAVRKGVKTMASYSFIIVAIVFIAMFVTAAIMDNNYKLSNFLPIISLPLKKYFQSSYTIAIVPFCEVISFFMLFPYVKEPTESNRALWKGVLIGAFTIFGSMLMTIAVMGPAIGVVSYPTYEAVCSINIKDTLTRVEVIYAGSLITLLFFKVSIVLFAAAKGIAQVFHLHSYKALVPSLGVLTIIFSLNSLVSSHRIADWGANVSAVYSSFFEVLLPGITLAAYTIKNLFKKGST